MADGTKHPEMHCKPLPRIEQAAGGLLVRAAAKINLNLLVGPRRADGYHPLDSYVARISLYDTIQLVGRYDGQLRLTCNGADCGPNSDNLALKAAAAIAHGRGVAGADIRLLKSIPPGKGLGGGSSDAAAVLLGLNQLWKLGLGQDELIQIGAALGSDVPMFLGGHASRMTGRGEILDPVNVHPFFAVLYMGSLICRTPDVYRAFDALPPQPASQIPADAMAKQPPSVWRGSLVNQLALAAKVVCPELGVVWDRLAAAAGAPVSLTGSGSALFILCDELVEAKKLMARLPADIRDRCVLTMQNPW